MHQKAKNANKKPCYQQGFMTGDGAESITICKRNKVIGGLREYYLTRHSR